MTSFSGGGFDTSSRSVFVLLAVVALLLAGMIDGRAAVDAARSPLAVTLITLAVLSIASSAWTVAGAAAAIRWGLVIAGYAAVFIAAATLARAAGPWPIAAGIAGLALIEAILGLGGVSFHTLPDAERIGQVWQPGGTFQYPPALAILEVGALPILCYAADRSRPTVVGGAAASAILAGAVLGLAGSRLAPALAAVLLLFLVARPPGGPAARLAAIATASFVLIGTLLAPIFLGGRVKANTPSPGVGGAAEITALAAAAAMAWPIVQQHFRAPNRRGWIAAGLGAAIVLAAIASAMARPYGTLAPRSLKVRRAGVHHHVHHAKVGARVIGRAHPADRSLLHGRGYEWKAAIETWLDRPALGGGADAYFVASLPHQSVARSRFAHNLPLELAAELGILGLLLGLALYGSTGWTISQAVGGEARWLLGPIVALFMIANLVDWPWHLAGLGALWAAASGSLDTATE